MKRVVIPIVFLLLLSTLVQANLYQQDELDLELTVKGMFSLEGTGKLQESSVDILLVPQTTKQQKVIDIVTDGDLTNNKIRFVWQDSALGTRDFSYTATLNTRTTPLRITKKIPYPVQEIQGVEKYLKSTEKIDSNNLAIRKKAAELAAGEDDLFVVAFNVAKWVSENIEYDLNELTTNNAQAASWVLENRQGVCDEMTSLYIAMMRSLGVPARFVSGISYTEHPDVVALVGDSWAGHGWAEVYFPGEGWVSFDLTFDEFGYIDPTHIRLREKIDPDEPDALYQWQATNVQLKPTPLKLDVALLSQGNIVADAVTMQVDVLADTVGYGSYNVVTTTVKNMANYYVAPLVSLNLPKEVEVMQEKTKRLLLRPQEEKKVTWLLKAPENGRKGTTFHYPLIISTEKNTSIVDRFSMRAGERIISKEEVATVLKQDSATQSFFLSCGSTKDINKDETLEHQCVLINKKNEDLSGVEVCFDQTCTSHTIPAQSEVPLLFTIDTSTVGWKSIPVHAQYGAEKTSSLIQYSVLDDTKIRIQIDAPNQVELYDSFPITITLEPTSFATPKNVTVTLQGAGSVHKWTIDTLRDTQQVSTQLQEPLLASTTPFIVEVHWQDEDKTIQKLQKETSVKVTAQGFVDNLRLFVNKIILLLQ